MPDSLPETWQIFNAQWHYCHWWQDQAARMITAMTTSLLLIALIALALALGTIVMVRRDGRGPSVPPRSHYEDRQFRSPAASF